MRKPIELNYIKRNGMLYPYLQISYNIADDKNPIAKYGMMWLRLVARPILCKSNFRSNKNLIF